jgi:hypothetical protein
MLSACRSRARLAHLAGLCPAVTGDRLLVGPLVEPKVFLPRVTFVTPGFANTEVPSAEAAAPEAARRTKMQQRLLTEVYGLLFLLLIVGSIIRLVWRQSKRTHWYLFQLGVTSVVAFAIALTVADDSVALVWVVLWVGLYWLWKLWNRWRGKGVANPADQPTATAGVVPEPQTPEGGTPRPLWRRVVRKTVTLAVGAFVFIVGMGIVMTFCLGYYERQAKAERDKVHVGMTVDEVLPLVHGALGIRTHAVLPDNMSDEEGIHYVSLTEHEDGTFGYSAAPDYRSRQLTDAEAVALMKQKMSDGYEWRWRYTFINDTPQHFSFTVTFGRDGRVKDVTDVWGWD